MHVFRWWLGMDARSKPTIEEHPAAVGLEAVSFSLYGLLRKVGRPLVGDPARRIISGTSSDRLRDLYEHVLGSVYLHELQEYRSELAEPERRAWSRRVAMRGTPSEPVTFTEAYEKEIPPAGLARIRARVRKRVTGWFKQVGRWPLPPPSKPRVKIPPL